MSRAWILPVVGLAGALALAGAPPLDAQEPPAQAVVTSDSVRLRAGPSLGSRILGKLDHGALVTVLARSRTAVAVTRGGEPAWWYQVLTTDQRKGWTYGAYVYLEAGAEQQPGLSFTVRVGDTPVEFHTRIYASRSTARPGQVRSLLALADDTGSVRFIRVPASLMDLVRAFRNEDRWYVMLSDGKMRQSLERVSVMEDKNLVTFEVVEKAGGGPGYRISLTCSYNREGAFFQVEYSETVPQ